MTEVAARIMQRPPETFVIVLDEKSPETIGVAGGLLSDRQEQ